MDEHGELGLKKYPVLLFLVLVLVISLPSLVPIVSANPDFINLYVNGYDARIEEWTPSGSNPYLDLQDEPTNIIFVDVKTERIGDFSFDDLPGTPTVVSVFLYVYTDCGGEIIRFHVWDGAGWTSFDFTGSPYSLQSVDITSVLSIDSEIDGAMVWVESIAIGGWKSGPVYVDQIYLRVEYVAEGTEYSRSVSQSISVVLSTTKLFEATRGVDQLVGVSLDGSRSIEVTKLASQGIGIMIDGALGLIEVSRDASQSLSAALGATRVMESYRTASQAISIIIQGVGSAAANFLRNVGLTISIAMDGDLGLIEVSRSVAQAINVVLDGGRLRGIFRTASQSISVAVQNSRLIEVSRGASQSIAIGLQGMGYTLVTHTRNAVINMVYSIVGEDPPSGGTVFGKVFGGKADELSGIIEPLFFTVAILVGLKIADQIFDTGIVPSVTSVLEEISGPTWVLIAVLVVILVIFAGVNI